MREDLHILLEGTPGPRRGMRKLEERYSYIFREYPSRERRMRIPP